VLRDALRGTLPQWVLDRPKQGFGAPVFDWMCSHTGALLSELNNDHELDRYLNRGAIASMLAPGSGVSGFELWPVLNFALWHRRWIQGEPLEPLVEMAG
jgi:asparagine synthase (glutamine-hydrolysing)